MDDRRREAPGRSTSGGAQRPAGSSGEIRRGTGAQRPAALQRASGAPRPAGSQRPASRPSSPQRPPQHRPASPGNTVRRSQARGRRRRSRYRVQPRLFVIAGVLLILILVIIGIASKSGGKIDAAPTPAPTAVPTIEPAVTAVPTAAPTTEPAAEPAATAAPVGMDAYYPDYAVKSGIPDTERALGLPACDQVPESYFDDAVFVGDSVTLKLQMFVKNARNEGTPCLGNAKFVVAGSMSIADALGSVTPDAILPSYQGQKMHVEDAIALLGSKKVFIMLGMNDIALRDAEENAQNMMRLIYRIKEKNPDATIFVQSCTPRVAGDYGRLNNDRLFEFDLRLYEYCKQYAENGIYFIDIAHAVRDEQGNLPENYCSDLDGLRLHFTDPACKVWLKYLYTHALNA